MNGTVWITRSAREVAMVFIAEDVKHHREVAIKVLRPELGAALGLDRFSRGIEISGAVDPVSA